MRKGAAPASAGADTGPFVVWDGSHAVTRKPPSGRAPAPKVPPSNEIRS